MHTLTLTVSQKSFTHISLLYWYLKIENFGTPEIIVVIILKFQHSGFSIEEKPCRPDQTIGAVQSRSPLFAYAYLAQNL